MAPHIHAKHEQVGFVTRYFLRRLALARRERHQEDAAVPHREAKVDVVLVFVAMPALAVAAIAVMLSLHWTSKEQLAHQHLPPNYQLAIGFWIVCAIVGNLIFDRRFLRYLHDPSPALAFDTERDRQIAQWQKAAIVISAAVVAPLLGLGLLYLIS